MVRQSHIVHCQVQFVDDVDYWAKFNGPKQEFNNCLVICHH